MAEKFLDKVNGIAEPVAQRYGCELIDAEYKKEGAVKVLRLYLDKADGSGVTLDDCADVSRAVSEAIDADEKLGTEENYVLEVSSPGVNRIIKKPKDYVRFSGCKVDVSLFENVNGRKKFTALLLGYDDNVVYLEIDGEKISVPNEKIGKMNLHFEF